VLSDLVSFKDGTHGLEKQTAAWMLRHRTQPPRLTDATSQFLIRIGSHSMRRLARRLPSRERVISNVNRRMPGIVRGDRLLHARRAVTGISLMRTDDAGYAGP